MVQNVKYKSSNGLKKRTTARHQAVADWVVLQNGADRQ